MLVFRNINLNSFYLSVCYFFRWIILQVSQSYLEKSRGKKKHNACPVYFETRNRRKMYTLSIHSYCIMTRNAFKTLSGVSLFSSGEMKIFLFYLYILSLFFLCDNAGLRLDKWDFDKWIFWCRITFDLLFLSLC